MSLFWWQAGAAPEDSILGIEDGAQDVAVQAAYAEAHYFDTYQGVAIAPLAEDVVVLDEPVYIAAADVDFDAWTDWSNWSWAQAPPIDDNDQEFLPASVSSVDLDQTDYTDYSSSSSAGEEQDAQLGGGVDGPDFTDFNDYTTQSDPLSEDAPAPQEDFVLGLVEADPDQTDFTDYTSQTDPSIDDNNPEFLPASVALDDQDFTDFTDYTSESAAGVEQDQELGGDPAEPPDFTDFTDYSFSVDPLSEDEAAPPADGVFGVEPDADFTDFTDYSFVQSAAEAVVCVFPTVVDVTAGADTADTSSHTVGLPGGIVAGQRLIVFFGGDDAGPIGFPGGWTEFFEYAAFGSRIAGAWRDADGTEGASITVTTSSPAITCAWAVVRLQDFASNPPEDSAGADANSANPDSVSLSPSWGSDKTLWFSFFAAARIVPETISAYPANYNDNQTYQAASGSAGSNGYIGLAARKLEAASENPGAFTITAADGWAAITVAVRGSCEAADTTPPQVSTEEPQPLDTFGYSFTADPVGADAAPDQQPLLGVSDTEPDFVDRADYGFVQDAVGPDFAAPAEDFNLGISESDPDFTDQTDYGFVGEPVGPDEVVIPPPVVGDTFGTIGGPGWLDRARPKPKKRPPRPTWPNLPEVGEAPPWLPVVVTPELDRHLAREAAKWKKLHAKRQAERKRKASSDRFIDDIVDQEIIRIIADILKEP